MSFRQFPASDDNGDNYVIIEFRDDQPNTQSSDRQSAGQSATPRYELADGRHLSRHGRQFTTTGGELTLHTT